MIQKLAHRTAPAIFLAAFLAGTPLRAAEPQAEAAPPAASTPAPAPEEPVDPARLEAARQTVQYIFPAGTYGKLMDRTLHGMMKPMMESVGKIPLSDIAAIAGVDQSELATKPGTTLDEVMAIIDPAFKERTAAIMPAMFKAMQPLFAEFEPIMQTGLAKAYARRFDAKQLAELNAFFATPTGTIYASNSILIYTDPDVLNGMQGFIPVMMKRMPEIVKQMQAELEKFPKAKSYKDLTPAQRKRIEELLGVKRK